MTRASITFWVVCLVILSAALLPANSPGLSARASALAQSGSCGTPGMAGGGDSGAKAPLMTVKGTVKANGDKYTFVTDKDSKSWDIMNPEALKGYEGHHVQLSAHVYADKNKIHVMSTKMLKGGSKDDSMSK